MIPRNRWSVVAGLALVLSASCGVNPVSIPIPTGPSELSLSLALSAQPDIISQDGVSVSQVKITARGATSQPVPGVSLRVDIMVEDVNGGLVVADFGSISNRWPTTGTDGTAVVTYRSPAAPVAGAADRTVTLRVTPVGSNFSESLSRVVTVLLVRPGVILPPTKMVPRFTYSPTSPRTFDQVFFDASSSSDPDGAIVSYSWQFGDGETGSGRQVTHEYVLAGTYGVVLTVRDQFGVGVTTAVTPLTVATAPGPVANFTISPTAPKIGTPVVFNAAPSTAPPGRRIVGYNWDLGDGTFAEGAAKQHTYQAVGTFTVVLVVTDDAGRRDVKSATVTVEDLDAPVADFVFSPTSPAAGANVVFNAAASKVATGRQIVSYAWNFGDGNTSSGATASNQFANPGTYPVVLTVTDNTGRSGVKSLTVTVAALSADPPFPSSEEHRR